MIYPDWEVGVLRIAKLGPGRESYYLQTVGPEPAGEWLGQGPVGSGLTGHVEGDALSALLSGVDPATGAVLGTARDRVKVAGFDLTFAAPKSVSILNGLAEEPVAEQVSAGHVAAVEAAVGYVEDHALGVRRRHGTERVVEPVDGLFGAAFVHRTSRALDPHLHTHVVVANLASDHDGVYSALDGRGIYAHAGAVAALYHSQLRYELATRLGVEWGPLDRGRADVVGITREVRAEFSSRSKEIAAELERFESTPGAPRGDAELAAMKTRRPKEMTATIGDLKPEWRKRALEHGLGPVRLEAAIGRGSGTPRGLGAQDDHRSERVVVRLAERGRDVTRRGVVQAWCFELGDGATASRVSDAADDLLRDLARGSPADTTLDAPGVSERRLPLDSLELGPVPALYMERAVGRGLSRGHDTGLGL